VRGGRCGIRNRIVEIARVRDHAGKQRIDVIEEIRAALGGNRRCERDDERRRAGGLRNQGQTSPLCAGCHLNVDPQPLSPHWIARFPKARRCRRPEAAHIPCETCQKETKAIDGGQSKVSVFAEEKPNLFVLWRGDHARGAGS
jgi:hypothetical protein